MNGEISLIRLKRDRYFLFGQNMNKNNNEIINLIVLGIVLRIRLVLRTWGTGLYDSHLNFEIESIIDYLIGLASLLQLMAVKSVISR